MYGTEVGEITQKTWEEYKSTHNPEIRNKILMAYLYIVKLTAKKMSASYRDRAELDDVVNQGVLALMDCIDKYDFTRGVQFDSYASIRVRGSVIDYIRKQDWVPRGVRKKSIDIENAYMKLQNELGRMPSDAEIAAELGMSVEDMNRVVGEAYSFNVLSFEELLVENASGYKQQSAGLDLPEQKLQEEELKTIISKSIDELSEKERTVISLYYYERLKLKEIAFVLDLTESRISQIHSKALFKLKCRIGSYLNN